jgi:hypothetical protein
MHSASIGISPDLLASYVEEQLHALDGDARRQRLAEIRADLQRSIDSGSISTEDDVRVAQQFIVGLETELSAEPVVGTAIRPKSNARSVRRGAMAVMPRASLLILSLLGAARSGNARTAVVGVILVALVLIARSAYISLKAASA